jgi:drug/metabolite transporter (DMT)-like permease
VANRDDGRSETLRREETKANVMIGRDARGGGTIVSAAAVDEHSRVDKECVAEATVEPVREIVDFRAYVYVTLMVVFGSTTAAAAKIAVAELPVTLVPAVRFGMAGLCLLPWVLGRGVLLRMIREDGLLVIATAALCVPINQGFFLSAARLGPTSHVGFFYATCPLVVLLLAWTMRIERPDRGRLWGVLASVAGIVVIGVGNYWNSGGAATAEVRAVVLADLLLVGAVVSWGGYIAVSKPLVERHGAMPALAATCLVGCLLSVPLAVWTWPGFSRFGQVSSSAWLALAILGLFITPLGWAFQNLSLRRFDASQVATFSNGSPFLTVVWGIWLFGELLTPALVVGGALTLGGIYWASRTRRPGLKPREFGFEHARKDVCGPRDCYPGIAVLALPQESAAQ